MLTGPVTDRLWAEDGTVFLGQGRQLRALMEPYGGYLHLVPRVLGAIGAWAPPRFWALFAVGAATVTLGVLAGLVFAWAASVTGSRGAAGLVALGMALVPALRFEVLGSIANLQWFLLCLALWALLIPPTRAPIASAGATLATALSTPLAVVLLPAALTAHGRQAFRIPAVWALVAGLGVQAVTVLANPTRRPGRCSAHSTRVRPWSP
jgi:hypothetical protein